MHASRHARIFDGHNDTLLDIRPEDRGGGRSFFERSTTVVDREVRQ